MDRGRLDLLDERRQVEVAVVAPGVLEKLRDQDVLTRLHRVGGDATEAEQRGRRGADLLVEVFQRQIALGGGEGAQDRQL